MIGLEQTANEDSIEQKVVRKDVDCGGKKQETEREREREREDLGCMIEMKGLR